MPLPIPKHLVRGHGHWLGMAMCLVAFSFLVGHVGANVLEMSDSCQEPSCAADLHPGSAASLLQLGRARESSKSVVEFEGVDGLMAPLNDAGYARVAALLSPEQMNQFLRRTASSMGLHITSPAKVREVAPHYVSEAGRPESFADLQSDILEAAKDPQGSWVSMPDSRESTNPSLTAGFNRPSTLGSMVALGAEALLGPEAALGTASLVADERPAASNKRSERETSPARHSQLSSMPASFIAESKLSSSTISGSMAGQETGLGTNAALDEQGYNQVVLLKSNHEMQTFLLRTIEDLGLKVVKEDGLAAMVPAFSGQTGSSSFGIFKGKVLNMLGTPGAWVIDPLQTSAPTTGIDAPLTEEGYQYIADLRSNAEMVSFIDRVVNNMGLKVTNHGGVEGLAPFFSGDKQVGSLEALESEIKRASKTPESWVQTSS